MTSKNQAKLKLTYWSNIDVARAFQCIPFILNLKCFGVTNAGVYEMVTCDLDKIIRIQIRIETEGYEFIFGIIYPKHL